MNTRTALSLTTGLLVSTMATAGEKPNVIFVLADDLGYGDISGLNPDSKISTPHIDRMCNNGIVFTDAHATSALSTPSRYSLLTGRYPWRTSLKKGVLGGFAPAMIAAERNTIANVFKSGGYSTACIGKWHVGWNWVKDDETGKIDFSKPMTNAPTDKGFDYFYGLAASLDFEPYVFVENNRATVAPTSKIEPNKGELELMHGGIAAPDFKPEDCFPELIRRSVAYIDNKKGDDKPFFLYLPITAPHTPVLPTEEFKGRSSIGKYGDFVLMIDDMMRQIQEALERNNLDKNTIVVFTSDNGCAPYINVNKMEQQGHYPSYIYRGYKSDVFEGGHRIPLIVTWGDKYKKGNTNSSLVSLADFYATFADMLGVKTGDNEAEDSFSFYPILNQKGKSARKDLVAVSGQGIFSIRTPQYKLIFNAGSGGWGFPNKEKDLVNLPSMQLYDIISDPSEKLNLIDKAQNKPIIDALTAKMKQYVVEGRSTPGTPTKNDTHNNWPQTKPFMK